MTDTSQEPQWMDTAKAAGVNDENLERFLCVVEKSARQWQVIVYPSLVAFIILAMFGFYLIYSLTGDIRTIAKSIDPNMGYHLARMTDSMQKMDANMSSMTSDIRSLPPMLTHIQKMDGSMRAMTYTNDQMRRSMATMTHEVARPMSMMNSFMPW